MRRKSKWRTRTKGSKRQIGKKFQLPTDSIQGRRAKLMKIAVPKGTLVHVVHKPHNPTDIQLQDLRSPYTGAPLEPAPEYGSSILYDPYSQSYVMVSVPEARISSGKGNPDSPEWRAKPRFTKVEEDSLKIAKNYLTQAGKAAESRTSAGVGKAIRNLEDAQRTFEHATQEYPTSGFKRDAVGRAILEARQYAESMWHSHIESKYKESKGEEPAGGSAEYLQKAADRIISARDAIAGT